MSTIVLAQKPFLSVQGEGRRTGKLTVFVRFMGCNLRCKGFFQKDPTNPSSYINPISISPKSITKLEDFPICEVGCDTLYSSDPEYKHLSIQYDSAEELVEEIEQLVPSWCHPFTNNSYDICFTGGEPLLHQDSIVDIINSIQIGRSLGEPEYIQIETNGTKLLQPALIRLLNKYISVGGVLMNVSPKLFNVTGEIAWYPEIINSYLNATRDVDLKFVVNNTIAAFDELDTKVLEYIKLNPLFTNIYVMPVGSSYKQQTDYLTINEIAKRAIDRGYHISGRLHCILFSNSVDR